ncbi:MAG: hypothetical protein GC204_01960 [Chloroflexi bacterium]|nr:hypothetical protein [Chloroflexota bacterium]
MRERFTYRFLSQLIGAMVAFGIVVIKVGKIPITINGATLEPGDLETLILAAGGVLAVIVPFFIPDSNKPIFPSKEAPLSEKTRTDNRQRMLDKVEAIWITGYLEHVLNEMEALRLEMKFVEPKKVLERTGMSDEDLPDSGAILSAFNDLGRRLVILGEPGAGKTVTLLQLCSELIGEARKDAKKPIPVVLALSSWAAEQLPFEAWLRKEVREKYGLSKKVADDLVVGEQLLYLLDGLDEVAEAQRDACLQAIQQFVEVERPIDYVICCRRKEFAELPTHLKIAGEVILQPLDDLQIGEYLSGDEFAGLVPIWNESATLRKFGRTPFLLNTIAVVTRSKSERDITRELGALGDSEQVRDALPETYVIQRQRENQNAHYSDKRLTRERLKWLSQQLIQHDQTDFYIENLQANWLSTEVQVKRYQWMVRLVGRLMGWRAGGLAEIQVVDRLNWRFNRNKLVLGLVLGLVPALVFTLLFRLAFGLVFGLVGGLVLGLVLALAFGLVLALASGFRRQKQIELRIKPNEGIRRSLTNFLVVGLTGGAAFGLAGILAVGLTSGTADGLASGTADALVVGTAVGLGLGGWIGLGQYYGGEAVVKHSIIRFFLAREKHIPYWRYDKFLDYCAEDLIILRKVGGGYRFVHDYMRQYLAGAPIPAEAED